MAEPFSEIYVYNEDSKGILYASGSSVPRSRQYSLTEGQESLYRIKPLFNVSDDFPDSITLKAAIHVMSDEFSSFHELKPNLSLDLVTQWLQCFLNGSMHPTRHLVDVYREFVSVKDWWWEMHVLASGTARESEMKQSHSFSLDFIEFWYLADAYSEALSLSDESGIPVGTCWDIVMDKVTV